MGSKGTCGVYVIWVKDDNGNEKPYIGSSKWMEHRRKQHLQALAVGKHRNYKLRRAWREYGPQAFRFEVLFPCEENERFVWEELMIRFLDSFHNGYNLTPNVMDLSVIPRCNRPLSDKTKKKLSELAYKKYEAASEHEKTSKSLKEFWGNAENRECLLAPYRTPEYRAKCSCLTTLSWQDAVIRTRRTDGLKKVMATTAYRHNLSASLTGKKKSAQHAENIALGAKKKYRNPAERKKTSDSLHTPDAHAKLSEKSFVAWQNPIYRDHLSECRRLQWLKPGVRETMGEKIAAGLAKPGVLEKRNQKISEGLKRAWARKKLLRVKSIENSP